MILTKEQIKADNERWKGRDIKQELYYLSYAIPNRCIVTSDYLRFNAFVARKALGIIENIQPEQRTGHWIPVGVAEVVGGESAQWGSAVAYHKCSACDEQALQDDFEQEVLSEFCPHCGAKMEGAAE